MNDFNHRLAELEEMVETKDSENFLRTVLHWHFSEDTGSPFWLRKKTDLGFDPLRDITSYSDLKHFPDCSEELRTTRAEDLIPRGLVGQLAPRVFESGGTTGAPKFMIAYNKWIRQLVDWRVSSYIAHPERPSGNTLAAVPTGPHIVGAINRERAERLGGLCFTIDIDPRWAKLVNNRDGGATAGAYRQHLVSQAEAIVMTQSIRFLVTTPPILNALLSQPHIADQLQSSLTHVTLGGTELGIDTVRYIKAELLPNSELSASYGSTSALGESHSPLLESSTRTVAYKSYAPYITYEVLGDDGEKVPPGERGFVRVSHLSFYAFYPWIRERDTAVNLGLTEYGVGSTVADIAPVGTIDDVDIVEGVY